MEELEIEKQEREQNNKALKTFMSQKYEPMVKRIEKAKEVNAQIICCSALLTTTMGEMKNVVEKAKELGCEITNIMQLIPVAGSEFENIPLVSNREIMSMRKRCESTLKQMYHCHQCRADAIGTLDNDQSIDFRGCTANKSKGLQEPAEGNTLLFAVSSKILLI